MGLEKQAEQKITITKIVFYKLKSQFFYLYIQWLRESISSYRELLMLILLLYLVFI